MAIEGGQFRCTPTGYQTAQISEWNSHCTEECDLHGETGQTQCVSCGTIIEYQHIPFVPLAEDGSKSIRLQCDNCSDKTRGKGQVKTLAADEEKAEAKGGRRK